MNRTLTRLAAAAALAAGFLAPSLALAQTTMKISISVAQNSHQGVAIDTFAREVEKRTNGRYKIQPFYSASLGSEREAIEAVQLGTQELTFTSTGPAPNFVRTRDSGWADPAGCWPTLRRPRPSKPPTASSPGPTCAGRRSPAGRT